MSEINMQISVTNLTQMDRHQSDTHRTPMVHQAQNAQRVESEAIRRMHMPTEADSVEKKRIDPQGNRQESRERRKKRRYEENDKEQGKRFGDPPTMIDISI